MTDPFQAQYARLNGEQKKAVDMIDGPLLVLAGPGTGKTQLLSVRAANMLRSAKVSPEEMLILTFTNAAARAMRDRLAGIIGHAGYNVEVETFHSFANSVVLESEGAIKYVKDKIEISEVEKVRALEYILDNTKGTKELRPFGAPYIHRREIEKKISELKNEGILPAGLKSMVKDIRPDGDSLEDKHVARLKELALIYAEYERLKDSDCAVLFDERGRIDYDDMILIALDALKKDGELRAAFSRQYKYVMVDEYQDTNAAQLELLFNILDPEAPNICCVGDDDQSIYRFQGATLSNFRVLAERFPALTTITLRDNYRSSKGVLGISGGVISQLPEKERITAKVLDPRREYASGGISMLEFLTEEEELGFIVEEIERQAEEIRQDGSLTEEERDKPFNNIAVLVRKRAQILKVIDAFLRAGIPYATDGEEDIRQEKRVRQMLDVLDMAAIDEGSNERRSRALYKVLTSDYTGVAHADVLKFIEFVNVRKRAAKKDKDHTAYISCDLFQQFLEHFGIFTAGPDGRALRPSPGDTGSLEILESLGELNDPHALHTAAWAITRLISDAGDRPVHDLLLRYVDDMRLYGFILDRYEDQKVLSVRDLRGLASFINMVKQADLARPAMGLGDFMEEMDLREIHGMPVKGRMATLSQDGVRVYTAHASKGMEFYSVFLPFCLDQKSWPVRRKGETIRVPQSIYRTRERADSAEDIKQRTYYDELRLFYVASTRAKAHLTYTATPAEKAVISRFFEKIDIAPESGSPDDERAFLERFLRIAPGPDPFSGTADILKDMVSHLTLNPTSLNNYIECERKFLYDNVLMLPGRKNQHLVFGNCAHQALEEVYTALKETGVLPDFEAFKDAFRKELRYEGPNSAIKSWCLTKLEQLEDWYAAASRNPVIPLELENKLEISLPEGLIFRGTFDKIEEAGPGKIRVVDYKTGKPDKHVKAIHNCREISSYKCDDYYRQLIAYKMLYERAGSGKGRVKVTKGVLQFLEKTGESVKKYNMEKGTYRNETVELTEDMVKGLEKVLMSCWRDIRDLKFDKLPERDGKERCVRCEYDHICWGM